MSPSTPILKIAVMADGRITVDAKPATIESVRTSLKDLARLNGMVWYYREAAHSGAAVEAKEVMQAVIENRLPIRMSVRPDYSDSFGIDAKSAVFTERFKRVREKAAEGQLVIVRPDWRYLLIPAPRRETAQAGAVAAVERIIPSTTKRKVAVIGDIAWTVADAPDLRRANEAIPFFGLLLGFASIGHSVWIFDGADDRLEYGCREADVLILDSATLTRMSSGWQDKAARAMRNTRILVHDRTSCQFKTVEMNR
jgi:hypothetical protein